jgi:hypothetical protein
MKYAHWALFLAAVVWVACGGVRAGNPQPPPGDFQGIAGRVLAGTGEGVSPLANVVVRVGDRRIVTDRQGFWKVSGEAAKGDDLPISVRQHGYAPYFQLLPLRRAKGRFVTIHLQPAAATKRISVAEGGVVVVHGEAGNNAVAVRIAPKSLAVSAAAVDVAVSVVRPGEVSAPNVPGNAHGTAGDTQKLLHALGTLDVSILADGKVLDTVELREPAQLQFALDEKLAAGLSEGATIPTWRLDPASGVWMGDGSALVIKQNERKLATWSAKRFAWSNLAQPLESQACLAVRLVPADDAARRLMQDLQLSISGVDYAGTSPAADFSDKGLAVVSGWRGHRVTPRLRIIGADSASGLDAEIGAVFSNAVFALPLTNASSLSGKGPTGKDLIPETDCLYKEYPFALSSGTIKGRIMDEYAHPLSGAVVALPDEGRTVVSASDGRFVFDGVPFQEQGPLHLKMSAIPPPERSDIYFEDVQLTRDSSVSLVDMVALVREGPPMIVSDAVSNSRPSVNKTIDFGLVASDEGPLLQWGVKACGQQFFLKSEIETEASGNTVLCHAPPGNPQNTQTISVAANAVAAHLAHHDYEGACAGTDPSAPPTFADTSKPVSEACTLSDLGVTAEQSGSS